MCVAGVIVADTVHAIACKMSKTHDECEWQIPDSWGMSCERERECVKERDRKKERGKEKERESKRERERERQIDAEREKIERKR